MSNPLISTIERVLLSNFESIFMVFRSGLVLKNFQLTTDYESFNSQVVFINPIYTLTRHMTLDDLYVVIGGSFMEGHTIVGFNLQNSVIDMYNMYKLISFQILWDGYHEMFEAQSKYSIVCVNIMFSNPEELKYVFICADRAWIPIRIWEDPIDHSKQHVYWRCALHDFHPLLADYFCNRSWSIWW